MAGKMELFLEFTGKLSTGGHSEARQGLCWGVSLSKGHTLPVITPRLLQWLVSAAFSHSVFGSVRAGQDGQAPGRDVSEKDAK